MQGKKGHCNSVDYINHCTSLASLNTDKRCLARISSSTANQDSKNGSTDPDTTVVVYLQAQPV